MIRTLNIVLTIACLFALAGVYALKYSGAETAQAKEALETKIERQKGDLSLLQADWAYLNQPGHIGPLVKRHKDALDLAPISSKQFIPITAIPMRPQKPDTEALDALFKSLASGVDPANAKSGGH